jgi:L-lactate dehydrogenase complex protein LldG
MTRQEIIDLFVENVARVAAEPIRIGDTSELSGAVARILTESDLVYCPSITKYEKLLELSPDKRISEYASASVCVEEAHAAIAETGSLVYVSRGGKALQAGLLCAHHVAILPSESIHESLDDLFSSLGDTPPTNVTLETGPSRTADIELTLTIGVHGPGRLTVIVVWETRLKMKKCVS